VGPTPSADTETRASEVALDRTTWKRFVSAVRDLARSEVGGRAGLLLATLLLLMLAINALNVVNSYVGRDFMTAIERRSRAEFVSQALLYAGVFALSTLVAVLFRFVEERLGLLWRGWLTAQMVEHYLAGDAYLTLKERGEVTNPDQRIADDTRSFTTSTLSFALMFLNGTLTILAFSGVLWSISPLLFVVAVGYAGLGSALTVAFGRPLVRLNYDQSDREASFRADLVHVRENAESIALLRREGRLEARLARRLDALVANAKRIIAVNRNLSFFTTGYNYGIQLIPALIIGPLFIRGQVEFGVITQSAMAFSQLLGAFSLVVTQFQSISSYAAVLARLTSLVTRVDNAALPAASAPGSLEVEGRLAYEDLTLRSRRDGSVLVERLRVEVSRGARVLVTGPEDAQLALFRATAGLWDTGHGRIVRPPADRIMFLPERPYLPPGTLREVLLRTKHEQEVADPAIVAVLGVLGLEPLFARVGGLDAERDWGAALSLSEQQLVAVARVVLAAPSFAVFQSPGTTLGADALERVVVRLSGASAGCLVFGAHSGASDCWDAVLELRPGGAWAWQPAPKQGVA
jgi:putative ATP-binding cassette transporter